MKTWVFHCGRLLLGDRETQESADAFWDFKQVTALFPLLKFSEFLERSGQDTKILNRKSLKSRVEFLVGL